MSCFILFQRITLIIFWRIILIIWKIAGCLTIEMLFCIRVNNRGVLLDIYVGNLFSRLACLQSNAQIKSEWVYIVFYTTIWHLCWKSSFHNLLPALESFLFQSNARMFSASESSIVRAFICYKCSWYSASEMLQMYLQLISRMDFKKRGRRWFTWYNMWWN